MIHQVGADIKVMQELLRHASSRVTMETDTQTVTSAKQLAQSAVVCLFHETPSAALAEGVKDTKSPSQVVPFCAQEKHGESLQLIDWKVASPK
jgi:hypothetical protein